MSERSTSKLRPALRKGYHSLLTYCPRQTVQLIIGVCAHDRRVLLQLAVNVHLKPT